MKGRIKFLVALVVACTYSALMAGLISEVTPTSPFLSWQSAVVFGGGFIVYFCTVVLLHIWEQS